jgi:hypothetical protein
VTIVSTAKRAHARLVEFIAVLMKADDQLDPNIVSISSLDNMQNSYGTDPMVDHEDIFRGAWKSEFCPPPHFESRMMLPVRNILGPIGTIHTGFDLVVVAGRGFIVLMAMTLKEESKKADVSKTVSEGVTVLRERGRENVPRTRGEGQSSVARSDGRSSEP